MQAGPVMEDNENGSVAEEAEGVVATGEEVPEAVAVNDFERNFKRTFEISKEITEVIDEKGHFQKVPAVPKEKYPTAEEVFVKLSELNTGFSKKDGFAKVTPEENKMFYFVGKKYLTSLIPWLAGKREETPDLAVDNSSLMEEDTQTKVKKHALSTHSQIVSEEIWNQLMIWFGGGPEVKVPGKRYHNTINIDSQGKVLRVVCQNDLSTFRRFLFSNHQTIEEAKNEICKVFGVDPEKCRLHDYYKHKPFAQLDKDTVNSVKKKLSEKNLMDNNLLFLEIEDEEGEYLIKYTHRGYQIRQSSDIVEGTPNGTKGVVGLRNIGNTCYMNSTLQCLSSLPLLKDQFLNKSYEADINLDNPLGYKGKVAKAFFKLMDKMWGHTGATVAPYGFKKAISDAKQDFRGYEQHDSQEFLSQLLDALHEDTNRIKNKPYIETPEQNGRPDDVVAAESMEVYKKRNDSLVVDLFTGLYKSTVTCPIETCGNVSVTFDPFMILSLPLQAEEKHYHVLHITHVPLNPRAPTEAFDLIVPKHGPFYLLEEIIKEKVGINKANREFVASGKGTQDKMEKLGMVFDEEDNMNGAKRDVLVFEQKSSRLVDYYSGSRTLSRISQATSLVSYEVFEVKKFAFSQEGVDTDYKRPLEAPRKPLPRRYRYERQRTDPGRSARSGYHNDDEMGYNTGFGEDDHEVRQNKMMNDDDDDNNMETKDDEENKVEDEPKEDKEEKQVEEQFVIEKKGEKECPFLIGDTWHGRYQFNEAEQLMRVEVLEIKKMTYEHYDDYRKKTLEACYNMKQKDTELTEEEFNNRSVYHIVAIADTKERQIQGGVYSYRSRAVYQTGFELRGVYMSHPIENTNAEEKVDRQEVRKSAKVVTEDKAQDAERKSQGSDEKQKDKDVEEKQKKGKRKGKSVLSSMFFGKNKGKEKGSKREALKEDAKDEPKKAATEKKDVPKRVAKRVSNAKKKIEQLSLQKQAEVLKAGELEKAFEAGLVVLRPTDQRQKYQVSQGYYNYSREPEGEEREPIVLTGVVDKSYSYFYGKYQVDQGFNKGEFLLQKYETYNWNHKAPTLLTNVAATNEVVNTTKYPEPPMLDERLLVAMCHRTEGRSHTFLSIPEVLFLPGNMTQLEFMEAVLSRLEVYLIETFKARGEERIEKGGEDEEDIDKIQQILSQVSVLRANSRFYTSTRYGSYGQSNVEGMGTALSKHSDKPLKLDDSDVELFFVIEWPEAVPFEQFKPASLFEVAPDEESKMNLNGALNLFSKTEKLNEMNMWYCRKCKEHRQAFKQLQLWSLPDVLVVQFKRFSQNEGRNVADKLEIPVDFPFEMNLADQVLGNQAPEDCEFELVAVSSHVGGGLGFGHYIACAKNELDGCWYEFNDRSVSKIGPDEKDRIVNPQAYVLFYAKKSVLERRKLEIEAEKAAAEQAAAAAEEPKDDEAAPESS